MTAISRLRGRRSGGSHAEATGRRSAGAGVGGSAQQLVLQALSSKKGVSHRLAEIRKLIDEMEKKAK